MEIIFEGLKRNPLGFWEVSEKPSEETLKSYYSNKYYQEAKGSYQHEYSHEELVYLDAKLYQRWWVIRKFISRKGSLLDVGCGEGFTIAFFRKLGWCVKGLDYSSAGMESKNPSCMDTLTTGDITQLLDEEIKGDRSYDVIWLQNVLEHVLDPVKLMISLRNLINAEGILLVTVPNDFSDIQLYALEHGEIGSKFWVSPPDHLNYFSFESLFKIGSATGWSCLKMLGDFPVDWFLLHPGSNYVREKTAGKAAHKARVTIENIINRNSIDDVISFWSAMAKIGMGRDLTAFFRPEASSHE